MAGWVKLHRCLINKPIFDNANLLKVWVWCLSKATHSEHDQLVGLQVVKLIPGQFIFGRLKASEDLKMPPSTVWRLINFLKKNESLDIKTNNKYSLVTINNWESYQSDENKMDTKTDIKRTTDGQQMDTNKNVKNVKNNISTNYSDNNELNESVKSFIEMRKTLKKPMTDKAITMLINKLNKLASNDIEKIEILNQSVLSSWTDIYKPTQQKLFNKQQTVREEYPEI